MPPPPRSASSRSGSSTRRPALNTYESVLEGYENVEIIGKGSFGQIRKVIRKTDGKVFARKELSYDRMSQRDRTQIVAEVNILRKLTHKNIVQYEERFADTESNTLYIVMEFCQGGDLGEVIKQCRRKNQLLPEDTVWGYFAQLVQALDACHNRRSDDAANDGSLKTLLHRDIKPENIFLDHENNVKLGDFGLSKELQGTVAFASTYVGTPYYMSPELTTGAAYDVKSDIWALACVIFELCALAPPFDAHSQAELTLKIKSGQVPRLPRAYSQELNHVVRTMLDLQPRRRPTTKQLLEVPHIKVTSQALELTALARQLKEREAALSAREEALAEREAGHNRLHTYHDFSNEEMEAEIEKRKQALESQEFRLARRQQELELEHERLIKELQDREAQRQTEFDAMVQREVESRLKAQSTSKTSEAPTNSALPGTTASLSAARRRRSLANLRSARSSRAGPAATSAADEWGNIPSTDDLNQLPRTAKQPSSDPSIDDLSSKPTLIRAPRSEPVTHKSLYSSPTQDRRPPLPPLSSRKSMSSLRFGRVGQLAGEKYNPAADKSDTTMKDVTVDEKENDSILASEELLLKHQRARRITMTLEQERHSEDDVEQGEDEVKSGESGENQQSQSSQDGWEDKILQSQVVAGLTAKKHDSVSSMITHPHSRPSSASAETQSQNEGHVATYDISNDSDLPSPFLRKPNSKAATNLLVKVATGKAKANPVGSAALLQRAAALRSAQNSSNLSRLGGGEGVSTAMTTAMTTTTTTMAKVRLGSDRPRLSVAGLNGASSTSAPPAGGGNVLPPSSTSTSSSSTSARKPHGTLPSTTTSSAYSPAATSAGHKDRDRDRDRDRARPSALSSIPSLGSGTGQGPRRSFYTPLHPSHATTTNAAPMTTSATSRD